MTQLFLLTYINEKEYLDKISTILQANIHKLNFPLINYWLPNYISEHVYYKHPKLAN